ncbi:MAG: zinc ribbon domain-containing protein [Betaproteobacteria bacterium]|nr:zinc ribbon domain-containing protein [Betaproteobacteria bacterium]MDE1981054.1 zinc ribbon domain-containing protein [Betaproteobacteria bacterium]MDE2132484.1 zinc ribbon domain-containing protein [Betaproteobacteria bacterium]MDE2625150.1 zinc ribbon domain-containing protein [Betaproteobacteria bacterium]
MPLYEFRCQACGHEIEVLQKISDPPRKDCPSCGESALVKKVTAAGFQLKGTGWYVTDFRGSSSTSSASSPAPTTKPETSAAAPATGETPAAAPADSASTTTAS